MKKRLVVILLLAILVVPFAHALTDDQKVALGYSYLSNQVDGKWSTLDSSTNSLALLALSYDNLRVTAGKNALIAKSSSSQCWPSTGCRILDTALATLALSRIGEDVSDPTSWLLKQQKAFQTSGIVWYLQVDSSVPTNCTVSYATSSKSYSDKLNINKDRTYSPLSSTCLDLTTNRYWIKIKSSCLDREFEVSCADPAILSMPYELSNLKYIPSSTTNTPGKISISTLCLKEGSLCNYEGTLWGAYALMKAGKEFSPLLPYLISESGNNQKLLPDALLFLLTSNENHAYSLLQKQYREGYWTDVGGNGKYWDTSMAALALADYAVDNATKARSWMLNEQSSDGSWGTYRIRDTAFALFSMWPKQVPGGLGNDCVTSYDLNCRDSCLSDEKEVTYSCLSGQKCCEPTGPAANCQNVGDCSNNECIGKLVKDASGIQGPCATSETGGLCSDNFDNDNNGYTDSADSNCQLKTCDELLGTECASNENCDGGILQEAVGTNRCCVEGGICVRETKSCSDQSGVLCSTDSECSGGDPVTSSDTSSLQYCCLGTCKKATSLSWLIYLLIFAVLAVAVFYFYKKGFFRKFMKPKAPGFGPSFSPGFQPPVRSFSPGRPSTTPGRPERRLSTETESALQDTMGQLRKFSGK